MGYEVWPPKRTMTIYPHWRWCYKYPLALMAAILLVSCTNAPPNNGTNGPKPADAAINSNDAIKIVVDEAGIYELNYSDLYDLHAEQILITPNNFSLLNMGYEQNFWVNGEGKEAKLYFYASEVPSQYTRENVDWLVPDGLEMGFGTGDPRSDTKESQINNVPIPEGAYQAIAQLEENLVYMPQSEGDDHWYWAGIAAPQVYTIDTELNSMAEGSGEIHLSVWGSTESLEDPDHHLRIAINSEIVTDHFWDGTGTEIMTATIRAGLLRDGINQISLEAPGDTKSIADIIHLNHVDIHYPRYPVAENDRLFFGDTDSHIKLSGFSGPVQVFDITQPEQVVRVAAKLNQDEGFDGDKTRQYLAVGPNGVLRAKRIKNVTNVSNLRASDLSADYLVIGPTDLLTPIQPLLNLRKEQGLSPVAIDIEAIYNQFNYGLSEPVAIQRFVQYAVDNWQISPKYLLLLGDSSYDPKGYVSLPEANRIPTYLINTEYGGETAGDINFVQVNEDSWPDLAVGHIPARSSAQVEILVNKILEYEKNLPGAGEQLSVLAIADGQDASFKADAEAFVSHFSPPNYSGAFYAPLPNDIDAHETVLNKLGENNWLIAYFGHGSINMWGKERLFTSEDVYHLKNQEKLAVILNFTCLTGLYTHPKVDSLAETLLWHPEGGAVAVLAPSSLTLPTDQTLLSDSLARLLSESPETRLGDIHLLARRQVPIDTQGMRDVLNTFLLYGDPALRMFVRNP